MLAQVLYTTWRGEQPDPTLFVSWGNVDAETRRAWETIARIAREQVAAHFVASMREECRRGAADATETAAVLALADSVLKGLGA